MLSVAMDRGHPPGRVGKWRGGGLSVKPKQGLGVLFYNRHSDGLMDTDMWHYTCPVLAGNKWVAQKFKGFESFEAHQHREAGLWHSTTPTDSGTASTSTHLIA
jgi:hypothetical protein